MEFPLKNAKLRPWSLKDASALSLHANNIKIANNLRNEFPHPYTYKDAINWLKFALDNPNLLLAICIDNEAVGGIAVIYKTDVYRRSAEIGYWLSEKHWNKGIMTDAIKTLVQHTFSNTEIIRIYAGTYESNIGSAKVLEKAGFKLEAIHKSAIFKNAKLMNEYLYAILKTK